MAASIPVERRRPLKEMSKRDSDNNGRTQANGGTFYRLLRTHFIQRCFTKCLARQQVSHQANSFHTNRYHSMIIGRWFTLPPMKAPVSAATMVHAVMIVTTKPTVQHARPPRSTGHTPPIPSHEITIHKSMIETKRQ